MQKRVLAALVLASSAGFGSLFVAPALASVRHPSWHAVALSSGADPVQRGPAADAAMATGARVSEVGNLTRLSVDLSAVVAVDAFVIGSPARAVIDLPEVNCRIGADALRASPKANGLIRNFRCGLFAPGRSRIVVDLSGPAVIRKVAVEPVAGTSGARLILEFARSDAATFRAAVRRLPAAPPPADAVAVGGRPPQPDQLPVVVIDAGHGGIDPGATGVAGTPEKTIVLDFASELAAKLTATGRYKVVMTRTGDSFVSLGERVRIARDADAALFVSVHADTLSDAGVAGATVYIASDRASDAEAARVAEVENRADEAAGLDADPAAPEVSDILFDLTRRETRTYAHLFQHTLAGYLQKTAHLNKNPERAAGFKVLQAPDVPSVLLELGYLSSDKDSGMLISPDWRHKATASVAAAVDAFFARRTVPDGTSQGTERDGSGRQGSKVVSAQSHL